MTGNLDAAFEVIDRFVDEQRQRDGVPGIAVGVTDKDRLLHVTTSGFADTSKGTPIVQDSMFHIGSISKSFASCVILQLVEEGKLDLHVPVKNYLPWLEVRSQFKPFTLHHLMTHTAGIQRGSEAGMAALGEGALLGDSDTSAEPGTFFHYSNTGYKLVGMVIEGVLGEGIADVLSRRVLRPLGMNSSEAAITNALRSRTIEGYTVELDDRPKSRRGRYVPASWQESDSADGSITSTVGDMSCYMRMILNKGNGPKGPIVSPSSFSLMTQKAAVYDETTGESYGYGLVTSKMDGRSIVSHTGGMLGFVATMIVDMDLGVGVIALVNCSSYDDRSEMTKTILRLLGAAAERKALEIPKPLDPTSVDNASEYQGTYESSDGEVTFVAVGDHLLLKAERNVPLERRGPDTFYADAPGHDLFLYCFGRKDGKVVEVSHGAYWFAGERYDGPWRFETPREWEAYTGHFRTHNAWMGNFRVVLRKDSLVMIDPSGEEHQLVPVGENSFRIDAEPRSPERVAFDLMVDGKAVRATLSGCACYRVPTP